MTLVDTNVLLSAAFPIEGHEAALELLREATRVVAPELWRVEFTHVVSKQVRLGKVALADARTSASRLQAVVAEEYPTPPLDDVLRLSHELRASGQDAIFLYWARELGVPLVTRDRRLVNASRGLATLLPDLRPR